jgi:hypothetical protein
MGELGAGNSCPPALGGAGGRASLQWLVQCQEPTRRVRSLSFRPLSGDTLEPTGLGRALLAVRCSLFVCPRSVAGTEVRFVCNCFLRQEMAAPTERQRAMFSWSASIT